MRSDPARVLREYALEPLRAELRSAGSRVLFVRGPRSGGELRATSTRFDAAWVELDTLVGVDAEALARDVARVLVPGARLVCVVPGGRPLLPGVRSAFRRDGDRETLRARRAGASAWSAALRDHVEWRRSRAFGVLLPGGQWPCRHPLSFALLAAAEHALSSIPPFRELGEWIVQEGVRR